MFGSRHLTVQQQDARRPLIATFENEWIAPNEFDL